MKKHFLVLIAATTTALSAQAQGYMEVGYASIKLEGITGTGLNVKASPSMVRIIAGYEVSPNFAIEGLAGSGLSDATVSGPGALPGDKVKISNIFGVYAKPKFNFSPNLEGFFRIGAARSNVTNPENGRNASVDSFSTGIGLSYAINKNVSVNIDSMSYYSKDSETMKGLTMGIGYKF